MTGKGIRATFTVTESGGRRRHRGGRRAAATRQTRSTRLRRGPGRPLLAPTRAFVAAYKAGDDDDGARTLYPPARFHWEAIEPVAESFGDLDPKTDAARPT